MTDAIGYLPEEIATLRAALASERESRLRAERERDEARADVAAAEGRERQIDRLEAALMDAIAHIRGEYLYDKQYLTTPQQANLDRWNAALSSPAVTAEGKKLGEEGLVTGYVEQTCVPCQGAGRVSDRNGGRTLCTDCGGAGKVFKRTSDQPRAAPPKTSEGA